MTDRVQRFLIRKVTVYIRDVCYKASSGYPGYLFLNFLNFFTYPVGSFIPNVNFQHDIIHSTNAR